jgi:hypothetical protein
MTAMGQVMPANPTASSSTAQTFELQPPAEMQAIACGLKKIKCRSPILDPVGFSGEILGWHIEVAGPLGRIYRAAAEAKTKYLDFSLSDVTADMTRPVLQVRAINRSDDMRHNVNVTHIVILPRGKKTNALQPIEISDWSYDAQNLAGASITRVGKIALFDLAALPRGDLDVVIVSDYYKDYLAKISRADRVRAGFGVDK